MVVVIVEGGVALVVVEQGVGTWLRLVGVALVVVEQGVETRLRLVAVVAAAVAVEVILLLNLHPNTKLVMLAMRSSQKKHLSP